MNRTSLPTALGTLRTSRSFIVTAQPNPTDAPSPQIELDVIEVTGGVPVPGDPLLQAANL